MKKKRGRGGIIAVVLVTIAIFGVIWGGWSAVTDLFLAPASNQSKQITLIVSEGETAKQVADDLYSKGLIRNSLAFSIWARIKGLDRYLKAGVYNLTTNMTIDQIIARLQNGQPDGKRLAVIDGFRIEQIVSKAQAAGLSNFSEQDFLNYTHHPDQFPDRAKYPILQNASSMEGLLYPDTYIIPINSNTVQIIDMMLDEFTQAVQQNDLVTLANQHKLKEYDMITLASIVQREASNTEDMPLIAGIYWNRIEKPSPEIGPYLQSDPTVEYARDTDTPPPNGKYWVDLNESGTGPTVDPTSHWNTYTFPGWPPTPISSPNLLALMAAASPASTDCYYFLSKPSDGRVVCAKTYAGFQQLVQQYLK
jgi:UPF0755 protein